MKRFLMGGAVKAAGLRVGLTAMIGLVGLLGAPNAWANDVTEDITGPGGTAFFGARHTDNAEFTDRFTFTIAGAVSANVSLITIGSGPDSPNNIDFTSAVLNGIALTLSPNGLLETATLSDMDFTGDLVLIVTGRSRATAVEFASYAGTMNLTVIPEPSTALLMGLGLGGLGLTARRARG